MPNKDCTIQQAFNDPMSYQLQMALWHCPRNLLSNFLTNNNTQDTWIWCPTLNDTTVKDNLKARTPSIVRWLTPPPGRLKLNVDGAFKLTSGEAGGGGILRDHEGNMFCAFARAYHGLSSSLAAEALSFRDGISICCSKGIFEVLVETDSHNLL
ncbi:hypothetical protein Taro_035658 [Colocasia esculenta]|uniref:RNase H type-1 domain-containing protein n=1 Tax=Colocasia esculenta TaxID=4460 RepID=A0A843W113_COLES|nr:hypothetical protein [Colocasia esculenta]